MSDQHQQAVEHLGSAAKALAVPAGLTGYGLWSLQSWALAAGLLSSAVVTAYTLWKWWNDWQDRRARRGQS